MTSDPFVYPCPEDPGGFEASRWNNKVCDACWASHSDAAPYCAFPGYKRKVLQKESNMTRLQTRRIGEEILRERDRQVREERRTPEHALTLNRHEGRIVTETGSVAYDALWPAGWDHEFLTKDRPRRRQLVVATALLMAEIERLDAFAEERQKSPHELLTPADKGYCYKYDLASACLAVSSHYDGSGDPLEPEILEDIIQWLNYRIANWTRSFPKKETIEHAWHDLITSTLAYHAKNKRPV
jgi:hypothetical protein